MKGTFKALIKTLRDEKRILSSNTPVSCDLEAAELARRFQGKQALIFKNTSSLPLVLNVYHSEEIVLSALEVSFADAPNFFSSAYNKQNYNYETTSSATFLSNRFYDLTKLPAIRSWEGDTSFALNMAVLISNIEEENNINIFRIEIKDKANALIHIGSQSSIRGQIKKAIANKKTFIEAAICIGVPTSFLVAGAIPLKQDRYVVAKSLMQNQALTKLDKLIVPSTSEIVLKGKIRLDKTFKGGSFGNFSGTYSDEKECFLFTLESGFHTEDVLCQNTVTGLAPSETDILLNISLKLMTNSLIGEIPFIKSFDFPTFGVFSGMIFISVTKDMDIKTLVNHTFFGRYRNICLFEEDFDTHKTNLALQLFANHGKLVYSERINIFDCRLKNKKTLADYEISKMVDTKNYRFDNE